MNQPPDQTPPPGYGHPQQPQQPGWGTPPPPPKKSNTGKIVGFGCGGALLGLVLMGGCVALLANGDTDSGQESGKSVTVEDQADENSEPEEKEPAPKEEKSQAEQFKECVAEKGTDSEKEAAKHVTKVTGADKTNDILDAAEVFTDYTGGLIGPHAGDGKLIAAAFASCYKSENGLVTVYDKDGEPLSTGNY